MEGVLFMTKVDIYSGFLGAGKTTLIKKMIAEGYKGQKLVLIGALVHQPTLLVLDEPAAGMNPQETLELTEFIGEIRKNFHMTILLIEHHMDLVMDIADRIYVLDFGKLIAQGTPEEIQSNEHVIDAYLGVVEDAED